MSTTTDTVFGACPHDCPDNCAMLYSVEDGRLTGVRGNPDHPVTAGRLCPKVNDWDRHHANPDRVVHPLRRVGRKGEGRFERIGWDTALAEIRDRWNALIGQYGPECILPYGYAGNQSVLNGFNAGDAFFNRLGASTGEKSFCASSLITAQLMTVGPTLGTDPESFVDAKLIVIWGANSLTTTSHFWAWVVKARRNGAQLVVIDPRRSRTAARADWHLAPKPGTDGALALAVVDTLVREELLDDDYVARHTLGFEALADTAARYPADVAADITGIPAEDIRRFARTYAGTRPAVIRVGVGLERYPGGGQAVRVIDGLPALCGHWRERGGGLLQMPVFVPLLQDKLSRPDWIPSGTRILNLTRIGALLNDRELEPPVASLFVWNANPVSQAPDSNAVVAGLAREDLFTVVSEHFVTDTARYADLVLPATMGAEHTDIQTSWGHFYVNYNAKAVEPPGEAIPNVELFRRLARTLGFDEALFSMSDEALLEMAFDWSHPYFGGKGFADLQREGFLRMHAPDVPHADGAFPTASGRCELVSELGAAHGFIGPPLRQMRTDGAAGAPIPAVPDFVPPSEPDDAHPLRLVSPKTHAFLNSEYANEAHKRASAGPQTALLHAADAARAGVADGDAVRLVNERGALAAVAEISDAVSEGVTVATFGYWPTLNAGSAVNCLTDGSSVGFAGTPRYYDAFVRIERAAPAEGETAAP